MSKLADALESGKFVVTSELNPPKGTDLQPLFDKADMLKGRVDAFNITDSHAAKMSHLSVGGIASAPGPWRRADHADDLA